MLSPRGFTIRGDICRGGGGRVLCLVGEVLCLRAAQMTRAASLYWLGVLPVIFLNIRLRWCGYWKPTS